MKYKLLFFELIFVSFFAKAQVPTANLHSWYKSDAGFTSFPPVWTDQSGNGNNLVPVDFGEPPSVESDGTNQFLKFATFTSSFPFPQLHNTIMGKKTGLTWPSSSGGTTVFMVYKISSLFGTGTAGLEIIRDKTQHILLQGKGGATTSFTNTNLFNTTIVSDNIYTPTFTKQIVSGIFLPNNIIGNKLYVNGILMAQLSTVGIAADASLNSIRVASMGVPSESSFDIYEILVYAQPLTDSERQQVENYLASKYNILGILPLSLISFKVQAHDENTILKWETENEINCSHFEIQKSVDGAIFKTIVIVAARNQAFKNYYSLSDNEQLSGNTCLYRLKIVDVDGKFKFSDIIKLSNKASRQLSIFPNPANNTITISGMTGKGELKIWNADSRLMMRKVITSNTQTLDISHIATGIYILQYKSGETTMRQKIVK